MMLDDPVTYRDVLYGAIGVFVFHVVKGFGHGAGWW